jgi:AraC family transcriptional regulator of adaptative response / DNA-3-methyladenine glycosylase II
MNLDAANCYRALSARDARFDGRFFTGVVTTGVYCRPVCPARTPFRKNVRFFSSAAAAERGGFRPCRRCRPESSPGTPAWAGTSATVSRALRLMASDGETSSSVEQMARRLGVGSRHLRRLFRIELGASPVEVAVTRRLHFAKKLLEETNLPVGQLALAAGFGSIRRFNEAFRETFGEAPGRVRAARGARPSPGIALHLAYRPPYDWRSLLEFLAARAIPGVESAEDGVYRRTFSLGGSSGMLEVAPSTKGPGLTARIFGVETGDLLSIVERVRRAFDLEADAQAVEAALRHDAVLAPLVRRFPGLRLPGCFDPFELAVRAILGQQVSVAAARTLAGRIASEFGKPVESGLPGLTRIFPRPAALSGADLSAIGLTKSRAEALRSLADFFVRDAAAAELAGLDFSELLQRLTALRGVGPWTAHYVAMRGFGHPDAFPAGDLVLRRAAAKGRRPLSERELETISQRWRPWRSYAALYLWKTIKPKVKKEIKS